MPRSLIAELIVSGALDAWWDGAPQRILDLCTGGASLAIHAAMRWPDAAVDASDLSTDALAVAGINVQRYGLAQRLRDGTRALHTAAERAGVMPAMLRGTLPAAVFWQMQRNLLPIYQALEDGLQQHAAHPLLAPLLARVRARDPLNVPELSRGTARPGETTS